MSSLTAGAHALANLAPRKVNPSSSQIESTSSAIAQKLKKVFSDQTVPTVADWLKLNFYTAKNKLLGTRDFSLEEVERMLHSKEGFQVLCAIMERAEVAPDWWVVCEPLMDLADIERMKMAVSRRVNKAVRRYDDAEAVLENNIRHTQALVLQGSGPARVHRDALQSLDRPSRRVVAKVKK